MNKSLGSSADLQLRPLDIGDEEALRRAVTGFQQSNPGWEFAFDYDPTAPFPPYVEMLARWSRGEGLRETHVPSTYLVAVVDAEIVGRLSIRHRLNDFLLRIAGHIGYGVVASRRGRGYATEILRQALPIAARLGIERALLTCNDDNLASIRVIERNGGVLENIVHEPGLRVPKRRYWIDTTTADTKAGPREMR